jgi:adenine-specific DNA-methyltransferase
MTEDARQLAFDFLSQTRPAPVFPTTRYQGSKRKLVDWIWDSVKDLDFHTVLDAFGGTGAVAYRFKQAGKQVTYNDYLAFNYNVGLALVENGHVRLGEDEIAQVLQQNPTHDYEYFITETFDDIYFTQDENEWLDVVIQNINLLLHDPYKRAVALFALYQACLVKRPYNLFHRKNLYVRLAEVDRSFGNKTTWDTLFDVHFRRFVAQANAAVFDNGQPNRAFNQDVMSLSRDYDLVYVDPPYVSRRGVGVDYLEFYHFLEGLTMYDRWKSLIDFRTRHRRMRRRLSPWVDKSSIHTAFADLFAHFKNSILVVSYRSDGIPTRRELVDMLGQHKSTVVQAALPQQYVLSKNRASKELLLIGV